MLRFFRKIRQNLLSENRVGRYFAYALGEILLVVIGILIALQVNNYRESEQTRGREQVFLQGLRSDLQLNLKELERCINRYQSAARSAEAMIAYFEGAPVTDQGSFNYHAMEVMRWEPFLRNNSTLKELISSGSLGILSDQRLKSELLRMELAYDKIDVAQEHMRFDYQEYLYAPFFQVGDVGHAFKSYLAHMEGRGDQPDTNPMDPGVVATLLGDPAFKNGFSLCILNSRDLIGELQALEASSVQLLERIDSQLTHAEP
ncbi:DUF6090 family protein [Robiginitalea marina]|uniref:DUF6090 family protein n=1 Tax=Robiginitalea marina TaxID=2954105 RepID=A0ABT1B2C9_9FLAO|nr:DUF6090 family protein [Robiginitalea marina]MCO5726035.1 DUF6090 family protein [Robiginitalea marina]